MNELREFDKRSNIFLFVIILLILIDFAHDSLWISLGENWFWALLGLKGLKSKCVISILNYFSSSWLQVNTNRGRSRIFFWRGCPHLLLYFNTKKPHSFLFFLQNTSCIGKPQVISGGGVCTPRTLPLDPPLTNELTKNCYVYLKCEKKLIAVWTYH